MKPVKAWGLKDKKTGEVMPTTFPARWHSRWHKHDWETVIKVEITEVKEK